MLNVDTDGTLEWCWGVQYALRAIGAYLQLGFSLGAVQARHACVPYQLLAYKARCAWRYTTGAPEDGPIYLDEGVDAVSATRASNGHATRRAAPPCAQASGAVGPLHFLAELLVKFDSLAAITHGEAVDVRLLQRLMHQDILVRKQRSARIAAAVAAPPKNRHASEESVVLRLAKSDATYASVVAAGHRTSITYRGFVILTALLSEAIAWDLLWIHEEQERQRVQQREPRVSTSSWLPAPPRPQYLTLAEERRFLQDDLHGFLTGKVRRNGDGTENQAMLPAPAIPLFLRMRDLAAENYEDSGSGASCSEGQSRKHAVPEDATQTATFKYKKGVLIKQGYEFDGSSMTCAEVPRGAWGSGTTGEDEATTTPCVRVYVLVSNEVAPKELALPPMGWKDASGAPRAAGYVPLTAATRAVLGANMEKCGW